MKSLKGKRVLVYGMGTSGQSSCKLLHSKGACVSFYDDEERFGNLFCYDKNPNVESYDLVVVSPGVKVLGNELLSRFLMSKVPVISELDLAYNFCKGKIVAITGTNGKTTVTSLVGKCVKESGRQTFVCGNIGLPFTSVCEEGDKNSVYVVEVSNFQLELSSAFRGDIACVLNLASDHIDRHGSFEEYVRVKSKILSEKGRQKVILNFDDKLTRGLKISKKVQYFSKKPLNKGISVKNNAVCINNTKVISCNDVSLFGSKNLENVLACVAICSKLHIKPKSLKSSIATFKAPPHRLEYLGSVGGAEVFDDSKATNISSVEMAVEALGNDRLVLLMGGLNKNCNFEEFFQKGYQMEKLYCFGQAGEYLYETAQKFGYNPQLFKTMKGCVSFVREHLEEGQIILLSPGCASFDEFGSYAIRGQVFKEMMFERYDKIENK